MFQRYVINKTNKRTNCFQGILVTLGTYQHRGELNSEDLAEAESIFKSLNGLFDAPPDIKKQEYRQVISWFNCNSPKFNEIKIPVYRAIKLLEKLGHEILLLEAEKLKSPVYSDQEQTLVKAGMNQFTKRRFKTKHPSKPFTGPLR